MFIIEDLLGAFYTLLLVIDGIVYNLVGYVYSVFDTLVKLNIFSIENYKTFVNNIYVILGVIMLFILAYSLLRAIIDPDQFAKGETSFPKLIKNVLVSLIIIVLLPTVFEFAYNFQTALLNNDVIPKLILGENEDTSGGENAGRRMAFYVFNSFFHPSEEYCEDVNVDPELDTCSSKISSGDGTSTSYVTNDVDDNNLNLKQANQRVLTGESSFAVYSQFGTAVADGKINYTIIISTIVGAVLLWVIISFCFDMAVRVLKLLFYQVIAPIPVVCRIIPGGHLKDAFSKWTKQVVSLFVEVFIRIAAITFGVSLIDVVISSLGNINIDGLVLNFVIRVLLIMGIIIFIKQVPKLIGDLFGLDTGGIKLGIMDKLAAGGGLLAGAAVGGGITAAVRNFRTTREQGGSIGSAIKSSFGGLGSGVLRSGYNAKGAKSFKDVRSAASTGAAAAVAAKAKRDAKAERYEANGQNALSGRLNDAFESVKEWAGIYDIEKYEKDNKIIDEIASRKKAVRTSVESVIDGEANKASSSFNYGGFSATELRQKLLDIDNARSGNLKDASGNLVSVSEAKQDYDNYRYNFSQVLQNTVLSQQQFDSIADKGIKAKLAEANYEAQSLKITLSRNLDKSYVKDSGFTTENVMGDLSVSGGPLKDIGDMLDLQKAQNNAEISKLMRQKAEKDKEKK